jgi:hypothetical protein
LQREHPRGGTNHRADGCCGRAHIPGFDAQERNINNAYVLRAIGRDGRGHVEIPCGTFYKQAMLFDSPQMRPPSDEGDVVTSLGKPGSEVSAYTPSTKDGDAHGDLLRVTKG